MNDSIQAIVFDVGGVLIRTVDQSGRRYWEQVLGLPPGGAEAIVLNSDMGYRAQRGEISSTQLWDWVGEHLNLGQDLGTFRHDFWRGDALDASLVELIRVLRRRYQLAIISNANDTLLETLAGYGLIAEFDLIVGSAYEGVMKPVRDIYERALIRLGRKPHETVFIDDSAANVAGALEVGMNAILYSPKIDLRAELSLLGVEID